MTYIHTCTNILVTIHFNIYLTSYYYCNQGTACASIDWIPFLQLNLESLSVSIEWLVICIQLGNSFHVIMYVHLCIVKEYVKMSLVTRKPIFGVFQQVRLKPTCTATEARKRLENLDIKTRGIILHVSRQRRTKVLIRLRSLCCSHMA